MQTATATTVATSLPFAAETKTQSDADLMALWHQYSALEIAHRAAWAKACEFRAQFDAQVPFEEQCEMRTGSASQYRHPSQHPLWKELSLDRLYEDARCLDDKRHAICRRIRDAKAKSMVGIGIKLCALSDGEDEDCKSAIADTLTDIDAVTGSDFVAFAVHQLD